MHLAVIARDEESATGKGRLRPSGAHVGIAEGPLELQARQISSRQSGLRLRLATLVRRAITPAVPGRAARGVAHRLRLRTRIRLFGRGTLGACETLSGYV